MSDPVYPLTVGGGASCYPTYKLNQYKRASSHSKGNHCKKAQDRCTWTVYFDNFTIQTKIYVYIIHKHKL